MINPQKNAVAANVQQQDPMNSNGAPAPAIPANDSSKKVSYRSLPKKRQLAFLCLARLADPLATTSISSYMFFQLRWFDPSQSTAAISTQAGLLIGARTAAQVCSGMFWGRFADSEYGGRKTVLSIGLLSAAISMLGYGFSTSFASAITWQIINGCMNANVSMVRCMVAELNPEKRYRTRALLLLPLCANAGTLLGPLVGGLLASNITGTRSTSGPSGHPYALPNIVIAIAYTVAALGVIFGVDETLEALQDGGQSLANRIYHKIADRLGNRGTKKHCYSSVSSSDEQATPLAVDTHELPQSPNSAPNSANPLLGSNKPAKKKRKLPFRRMWTFNVICTMLSHFIISGHIGTFTSMSAIFLSTPTADPSVQHPPIHFTGGLGMDPRSVGLAMSLIGGIGVVLQAVVYPSLNDRFGTVKIWRAAMYMFPLVYLLAPYPALVASSASLHGATKTALTWTAMIGTSFLYVTGRTGTTPATALLINDCTPHPSVRATIHTTATMVGNLSRSIFPVMALSIFGYGLKIGVVGLGFWCIMLLAVLACVASRWVTEGTNGKEIVLEGEDEDEQRREANNGVQQDRRR